jgi:hypothetical protein
MLLIGAVVLAFSGNGEAKGVVVEFQASVRVADDDRTVVNSKGKLVGCSMPFGSALVGRGLQDFSGWPSGSKK